VVGTSRRPTLTGVDQTLGSLQVWLNTEPVGDDSMDVDGDL
jgi:hypothetical protein